MAPAVSSLLSTPSSRKSLAFSRMPCTESDVLPRIETSVVPLLLKNAPSPLMAPERQRAELHEVAAVERQVGDLLAVDDLTERAGAALDLDQHRRGGDGGLLLDAAERQGEVTSRFCCVSSWTSAAVASLNPGEADGERVAADGQQRELETPLLVGGRFASELRALLGGDDGRARQHAAGGVADAAVDGAAPGLGERRPCEHGREHAEGHQYLCGFHGRNSPQAEQMTGRRSSCNRLHRHTRKNTPEIVHSERGRRGSAM